MPVSEIPTESFRCPNCRAALHDAAATNTPTLECGACDRRFPIRDGIPLLLESANDTTATIRSFYEAVPFPNYDAFDDAATLMDRSRDGLLARLLDEQLPLGTRVLEAGCGTGQLSNFLAIGNRQVYGADLSLASLQLAQAFKTENELQRAHFLQMNLFHPCFAEGYFDLVLSNGVLHHTADPAGAIAGLARLLKPGGYLVVGLYHRYGRLATDLRRLIFRLSGGRGRWLDKRNVDSALSAQKREAWYRDQYQNPFETKHTIAEAAGWLEAAGLSPLCSLPSRRWLSDPEASPELFQPEAPVNSWVAWLKELSFALRPSQIREGGFFVVVGQRPADGAG